MFVERKAPIAPVLMKRMLENHNFSLPCGAEPLKLAAKDTSRKEEHYSTEPSEAKAEIDFRGVEYCPTPSVDTLRY
jgi:hypothetical protein